jgi:RNA polymerase sigma-70 factor (ECF subfamily)
MMSAMKARAEREGRGTDPADPATPRQVSSRQPASADLADGLAGARRGDEDGFRVVYRAVQPPLLRYVRGLVGDDAEDVTSDAWVQIARDIGTFEGDSDGFRAWAATIARNRALDHLRRLRRRPVGSMPIDELADVASPDDTAAGAIEAVSTDAAIALIAGLPREQAEAILLRVVMGLDAATAGRVLGKRAGAVRTAAHRGLRRLADQLNSESGDAPESRAPDEGGRGQGE